ncbi:MAG: MATE family efflux transporter [Candidatus Firestonebacteria bacterium]
MKDFTQGSVPKQLFSFAVPLLLGNFLQSAIEFMNMFWVGRLLGHKAIAAVATSLPIVFFLISALIGLSVATNIIVAQAYGSKNFKFMEKVFSNSFMTNLALCVVISFVAFFFSSGLLGLVNCPLEIKPQANSFFRIIIIGLSFNFIYNWYSGILRGLGDSKTPLYILILNAIINFISVPIFIRFFGLNGAPIANIGAGIISGIVGYIYTSKKNPFFKVHSWDFTVEWDIIKKIFTLGIPASLQMVIMSFAGAVIISLVNKFGLEVTAAYGICMQVDQMAFLPSLTIGIAITSMVGQNLSAGKFDRIKQIFYYGTIMAAILSLTSFILVYSFPEQIAKVFNKDPKASASVIKYVVGYIRITSFGYIGIALMFCIMGVVRGSGDMMAIFILTFISAVMFRIPLSWILSQKTALAEKGIWIAILISIYVTLILDYIYYKSGRWKKVKLIHLYEAQEEQSKALYDQRKSPWGEAETEKPV